MPPQEGEEVERGEALAQVRAVANGRAIQTRSLHSYWLGETVGHDRVAR
jgi:hypothetical protein